jgi:hypothetical protein
VPLQWFNRVWTVQESALARECRLFWGDHGIDIADVFEISLWCKRNYDLADQVLGLAEKTAIPIRAVHTKFLNMHAHYGSTESWQFSRPGLAKDDLRYHETRLTLVLYSTWYLEATDDRDYVYAFLGSAYAQSVDGAPFINVDYTRSVAETYYGVACALLQHPDEGPWVLSAVANNCRQDVLQGEYPSWVPRWNKNRRTNMLADPTYDFQAGGPDRRLFFARIEDQERLRVTGFIFDSLVWIAPHSNQYISRWSLNPFRRSKAGEDAEKAPIDVLADLAMEAASKRGHVFDDITFTLTLVQGYYQPRPDLKRHRTSFAKYRTVVRAAIEKAAGRSSPELEDVIWQSATSVANSLRGHNRGKSLFLTENGRFGLASSAAMEVGDMCCIILGTTVPFVVAPASNGCFRLVGEAYVSGVMAGELANQHEHIAVVLE